MGVGEMPKCGDPADSVFSPMSSAFVEPLEILG